MCNRSYPVVPVPCGQMHRREPRRPLHLIHEPRRPRRQQLANGGEGPDRRRPMQGRAAGRVPQADVRAVAEEEAADAAATVRRGHLGRDKVSQRLLEGLRLSSAANIKESRTHKRRSEKVQGTILARLTMSGVRCSLGSRGRSTSAPLRSSMATRDRLPAPTAASRGDG